MLELAYHRKTNIECVYVLGDFGVEVRGRHAAIVAPVRELAFGDWTRQGLPFYAGHVTYHCAFEGTGAPVAIDTPHIGGALVKAALDGADPVPMAFAPFRAEFGVVPAGSHRLDITVFGTRANAFGQLHHERAGTTEPFYWGPDSWRSSGTAWLDEYRLWPMGLLSAPRLLSASRP
jgi:hypothetical protein